MHHKKIDFATIKFKATWRAETAAPFIVLKWITHVTNALLLLLIFPILYQYILFLSSGLKRDTEIEKSDILAEWMKIDSILMGYPSSFHSNQKS